MRILFYYPSNKRTIPIDLPLFQLQKRGHVIFLLTTESRGPLHELYETNGAHAFSNKYSKGFKWVNYLRQILFLVKFCKTNKIDIVHSHLQQANVISVVAKYFFKAKLVVFRHHCKFQMLVTDTDLTPSKNEVIGDKIINRLSSLQIVPSNAVKEYMIRYEKVQADKIKIIPYMYDFDNMLNLNHDKIAQIRNKYNSKLLIIMVSRLTPFKRHLEALIPISKLIKKGLDIKLLIMDDGPMLEKLSKFVSDEKLNESIHFLGFQSDILNYIGAADIIVHPSLTDASNSAVKEAAILEKIVIACNLVGDVNEYIVNKDNGFLVEAEFFQQELLELLPKIYENRADYSDFGSKIKGAVINKYGMSEDVVDMYEILGDG